MRLRSFFVIVAATTAGLTCTGCGGSARAYQQTRHIPVTSEAVFSPEAQLSWVGDRTVYELPANPPAIEELHRARRCEVPGVKLPPTLLAGVIDEPVYRRTNTPHLLGDVDPLPWQRSNARNDVRLLAAVDDRGMPRVHEPVGVVPLAGVSEVLLPIPRTNDARPLAAIGPDGRPCSTSD